MLFQPIDCILDRMFVVSVEQLRFISDLVVGALNGASDDYSDTSTIFVAVC